jgi:hypothetical protein
MVMAKADSNVTTWILLRDALALVMQVYQAAGISERLLIQWLADGKVRWRSLHLEGYQPVPNLDTGVEFWQPFDPGRTRQVVSTVNWLESSAHRGGMGGCMAYRIELVQDDVVALLPAVDGMDAPPGFIPGSTWISAEARRMKGAGEISPRISKTDLAKALAHRMLKASEQDPTVRPIGWESIRNRLGEWGLWPITSI